MGDQQCKYCGTEITFIRFRRDDVVDTWGWCHASGELRCNPIDFTIAEPTSGEVGGVIAE